MKAVFFIGTVHDMLPAHKDELRKILEKINPDQIMVEIVNSHLKTKRTSRYPKEMVYAADWGKRNKKVVTGFDAPIKIDRKDVTKHEDKKNMGQLQELCRGFGWKEFNKRVYPNKDKIYTVVTDLVDWEKHIFREKQMLKNIRKRSINGKVLILTGAFHLQFFEENFRGAIFPLRI